MFRLGVLMFIILGSLSLQAQNSGYEVRGLVRDADTRETLPVANVFFSGTTYGTITNNEGNFSLKPISGGTYELVISYTGYQPYRRQVNLIEPGIIDIEVFLQPEPRYIGGVTVVAKKDKKWKERLDVFQRVFVGYSRNAVSCKIINEEILHFEFDEENNVLEAFAGEPLIIENRTLGYRLTYVLEHFKIYYNEGYSDFYGFPSFEELNPEGPVKKKFIRARKRAYNGSVIHFLSALYQGRTVQEGFEVSRGAMIDEVINITKDQRFDINSLVTFGPNRIRKQLSFDKLLFIEYHNELPEPGFLTSLSENASPKIRNSTKQISWLQMPLGVEKAIFEQSGLWLNIRDFILSGYWSYEKVADLLPTNYEPQDKSK